VKNHSLGNRASRQLKSPVQIEGGSSDHGVALAPPPYGIEFVDRAQVHPSRESPCLQPKLTVASAGDAHEQEADRVADQVMRMPDPVASSDTVMGMRDSTAGDGRVQRMCEECEEKEGGIQRRPAEDASAEVPTVTPQINAEILSLEGTGQPLPESARTFFEPRFQHDFGNVRLYTGQRAADTARAVSARAFAIGNDVVFGAGEFAPDTHEGRHLLAHELTHVVQQKTGTLRRSSAKGGVLVETPETLAKAIREAFRGPGTDEDEVYRALSFPPATVRAMINYYNDNLNDHTGKGLFEDLQDELSGDELDRAVKLLINAEVNTRMTFAGTAIPSTVPGEPDKRWVGLLVRGKYSEAHAPGVMEQHADVLIAGAGGPETVGYFGEKGGPGVAGSGTGEGVGLGMQGVSADMAWFLLNRPQYVDLQLAIITNTVSSLILLKVTKKQADTLAQYWDDLKKDPGTFNILGANCSTAAAAGFTKADVTKEISGLDTPDNLFNQLKKEYPGAYMISGHFGYERAGRKWDMVAGKLTLTDPGTGPWMGPLIVERRLS